MIHAIHFPFSATLQFSSHFYDSAILITFYTTTNLFSFIFHSTLHFSHFLQLQLFSHTDDSVFFPFPTTTFFSFPTITVNFPFSTTLPLFSHFYDYNSYPSTPQHFFFHFLRLNNYFPFSTTRFLCLLRFLV